MVRYTCSRCGYHTHKKCDIKRHIGKKKICPPLLDDTEPTLRQNVPDNTIEQLSIQELKRKNEELEKRIEQMENMNINIATNIENYNQTINVVVLPHTNPSLDYLTDKDFKYCINRMIMSVPSLIRKVHFDPSHPENHNICISNIKDTYAMTFDGTQWNLRDRQQLIDDLIDDYEYKLEEWLQNGEKEHPKEMKKFQEYLDKKEQDGILDKIKQELKLMLYNNRNMVKK